MHGTKLNDLKRLTIPANTLLLVKQWSGRGKFNTKNKKNLKWQQDDHCKNRDNKVQKLLQIGLPDRHKLMTNFQ